jgi:hypothetical protein
LLKQSTPAVLTTCTAILAIAVITVAGLRCHMSEAMVNLGVAAIAGLAGYAANSLIRKR